MRDCHRTIVITAITILAAPAALHAQQCAGAPTLAGETVRVGGGLVTGAGISGQVAQLALGHVAWGHRGFGEVTVSRVTDEDVFDTAAPNRRVDPAYGVDLAVGVDRMRGGAAWCPVAAAGFTSGPEVTSGTGGDELETEAKTWHAAAGTWLGLPRGSPAGSRVIPAIGARLVHAWGVVTNDGTVGGVRVEEAEIRRDTYAVLSVAVGGIIGGRVLVRPQLDLPVGRDQRDTAELWIGVAFVFGP